MFIEYAKRRSIINGKKVIVFIVSGKPEMSYEYRRKEFKRFKKVAKQIGIGFAKVTKFGGEQ